MVLFPCRSLRQLDRDRVRHQVRLGARDRAAPGNGRPWPAAVPDLHRAPEPGDEGHAVGEVSHLGVLGVQPRADVAGDALPRDDLDPARLDAGSVV